GHAPGGADQQAEHAPSSSRRRIRRASEEDRRSSDGAVSDGSGTRPRDDEVRRVPSERSAVFAGDSPANDSQSCELNIVDDTHQKIYVDHKDDVVLKKIEKPMPEEPDLFTQPPLSEEGKMEQVDEALMAQVRAYKSDEITKEIAEKLWKDVVDDVRGSK